MLWQHGILQVSIKRSTFHFVLERALTNNLLLSAINNNPFEYWITYKQNPEYEKLMINVEKFLDEPGDKDVLVKEVFTEEMFTRLDSRLTGVGWTSVRSYWESDFQNRNIVSGFMKVCCSVLIVF